MSDPREDLLGYLLDALEESERARVEAALAQDVALREELAQLRQFLSRLEPARQSYDPPAGLVERTLRGIAAHAAPAQDRVVSSTQPVSSPPQSTGSEAWGDSHDLETIVLAGKVRTSPAQDSQEESSSDCPNVPSLQEYFHVSSLRSGTSEAGAKTLGEKADSSPRPRFLDDPQRSGSRPTVWRWHELAVAAAVVVIMLLVVFSAVHHSRFHHEITQCQNNLRQLGMALIHYSELHRQEFPAIPTEGPLAVAGLYGPILLTGGFVSDQNVFFCPGAMRRGTPPLPVPTLPQLERARPAERERMVSRLGGDYGYSLGYMENGEYRPTRNRHRSYFAILADAPNARHPEVQSLHHGAKGQNIFFEDGHVQFVCGCRLPASQDHFFLNAQGELAPGVGPEDSVVAPSDARPNTAAFFLPTQ